MDLAAIILTSCLFGADFTICDYDSNQIMPCPVYFNNQYYVFWSDYRVQLIYALYGSRVATDGTVIDPDGKLLYQDSVFNVRADNDGTNLTLVWREGC